MFSLRVGCLIEGRTPGQVRRLGGCMWSVGHRSKSSPRVSRILGISLGRSGLELRVRGQEGIK